MYTIKALIAAFLAGVILAGGAAFMLTHRSSDPSQPVATACSGTPALAPAPTTVPSKAWEYSRPAPTTGGVRPTELKNHPHPLGSGD